MRTWAIGDIHGCWTKLSALIGKIPSQDRVVFLGDYIDRGPHIKEVCLFVLNHFNDPRYTFLVGNHEELFMAHMNGQDREGHWALCGGDKTMEQLSHTVATSFNSVCKTMLDRYENATNYFVHGGMSPGVPFLQQSRDILLWYRPMEHEDYNYGKFLVHGHTPVRQVDERTNRVNIDTGAVFGLNRHLTAVRLSETTGYPEEYLHA